MNQSDAETEAARLQTEHADCASYRFFAKRTSEDSWTVSKLRLPGRLSAAPTKTTAEHPPHHPYAIDTRTGHEMRIPGLPGGLG